MKRPAADASSAIIGPTTHQYLSQLRARRRSEKADKAPDAGIDALRAAQPAVILEHDAGDAEFVVLIARAMPGGHVGIVAKAAEDPALIA